MYTDCDLRIGFYGQPFIDDINIFLMKKCQGKPHGTRLEDRVISKSKIDKLKSSREYRINNYGLSHNESFFVCNETFELELLFLLRKKLSFIKEGMIIEEKELMLKISTVLYWENETAYAPVYGEYNHHEWLIEFRVQFMYAQESYHGKCTSYRTYTTEKYYRGSHEEFELTFFYRVIFSNKKETIISKTVVGLNTGIQWIENVLDNHTCSSMPSIFTQKTLNFKEIHEYVKYILFFNREKMTGLGRCSTVHEFMLNVARYFNVENLDDLLSKEMEDEVIGLAKINNINFIEE